MLWSYSTTVLRKSRQTDALRADRQCYPVITWQHKGPASLSVSHLPKANPPSPLRGELVQGSTRRIRLAGWKECIAVRERLPYSKHVYAVVPCIEREPIVEPCPTASAPPNLPNLASTESVHPTRLSHTLKYVVHRRFELIEAAGRFLCRTIFSLSLSRLPLCRDWDRGVGQGLIEYGGSIHPPSKRRRSKKSHTNSRVSDIVDARTKLRAEQEFITTDHDAAMVGYLASGGDWGVG